VLVLAELEEIAITTILPEWRTNVPSILHARRCSGVKSASRFDRRLGHSTAGRIA
jgi:hypothetical protein